MSGKVYPSIVALGGIVGTIGGGCSGYNPRNNMFRNIGSIGKGAIGGALTGILVGATFPVTIPIYTGMEILELIK